MREGSKIWMTREIGVRYLDLGYLEFRLKRQGEEDGRKGTGCIRRRRCSGVAREASLRERRRVSNPTVGAESALSQRSDCCNTPPDCELDDVLDECE